MHKVSTAVKVNEQLLIEDWQGVAVSAHISSLPNTVMYYQT